jgi:Skp family chaperone for outer membrane proteins
MGIRGNIGIPVTAFGIVFEALRDYRDFQASHPGWCKQHREGRWGMKHLCTGGALGLFLVLAAVIGAVTEASAKVGIIDTQEVLRDSRAAKDARAILLEDLKEKSSLFNKKQDELRLLEEELNRKNVELTQRILEEVGEIINEFRKKNKFSLILETKTVVSHDEGIDITKDIIKLYDARKK